MGAEPYCYWVPYEPNIRTALQKLRDREFQAGRYQVASDWRNDRAPTGPRHTSIDEAREAGAEGGTCSILDIERVGLRPGFLTAGPLGLAETTEFFGSDRPTRRQIEEAAGEIYEDLDRGHCVYVIAYEGDTPTEIYFAGYSFD